MLKPKPGSSLSSIQRVIHLQKFYSNDAAKTFREKGLSEENRYFAKKQEEELRRLRKQIMHLESNQKNLQNQLDKANKILKDITQNKDCKDKE